MSVFHGGSPFTMVRDMGEGYVMLTPQKLKRFTLNDLLKLKEELDRQTRILRTEVPAAGDAQAIQKHNRKMQRLSSGGRVINTEIQAKRKKS